MLFNSIDFAVFLPIVFILYWAQGSNKIKEQNLLLFLVSYVFYGWWDWRFLSLIFFSTLVDYTIGVSLKTNNKPGQRKVLLWASIIVNLGFLGFFKYYNFFLDNFISAFTFFGGSFTASSLQIILPVGISFYTFQTMSYAIDIYRDKIKPTKNIIDFGFYVSFFPQLVAGPIVRPDELVPQFASSKSATKQSFFDGLFGNPFITVIRGSNGCS